MITPQQQAAFLRAIRAGASIKDAAATAGIHRPRIYTLRDRDPEFAAQLAEAREPQQPVRETSSARPTPVGDIPREARDHLRAALKIIAESRKPKPPSPEKVALEGWLRGEPWPDAELDANALGKLSARALADYRRHIMVVEAERFANGSDDATE